MLSRWSGLGGLLPKEFVPLKLRTSLLQDRRNDPCQKVKLFLLHQVIENTLWLVHMHLVLQLDFSCLKSCRLRRVCFSTEGRYLCLEEHRVAFEDFILQRCSHICLTDVTFKSRFCDEFLFSLFCII